MYLLQQQSLLVPFCQLIGREGTLDTGPNHYAVVFPFRRHHGNTSLHSTAHVFIS